VYGPVAPSSDVDISKKKKINKNNREIKNEGGGALKKKDGTNKKKTSIKITLARAKTGRPVFFFYYLFICPILYVSKGR
jgi:hypothetical protein